MWNANCMNHGSVGGGRGGVIKEGSSMWNANSMNHGSVGGSINKKLCEMTRTHGSVGG